MTNETQQPQTADPAPIEVQVLSVDLPDDVPAAAREHFSELSQNMGEDDLKVAGEEFVQIEGTARVAIDGSETTVPLYVCTSNSVSDNPALAGSGVHVWCQHDGTEKCGLDEDTMWAVEDALRQHPEVQNAVREAAWARDEHVDEVEQYERFFKTLDNLNSQLSDLADDRKALAAAIAAFDSAAPDRAGEFEAPEPADIMCDPDKCTPDDLNDLRDDLKDIAEERAEIADVMKEIKDAMRELEHDGTDPTDDL